MLVQAVLQWSQRYASLQLDAMHAARLQMVLEQAAPRFERMELQLPRDDSASRGRTESDTGSHLTTQAARRVE